MGRRFVIKKVLIIPALVASLLCSTMTVMASEADFEEYVANTDEIAVEIEGSSAEVETYGDVSFYTDTEDNMVASVGGGASNFSVVPTNANLTASASTENSLIPEREANQTAKEYVIEQLDKIIGTDDLQTIYKMDGLDTIGGHGKAYTEKAGDDAYYGGVVSTPGMREFLNSDVGSQALKAVAGKAFDDVDGDEWFADSLALATYFYIGGTSDTEFSPDANVRRMDAYYMMGNATTNRGRLEGITEDQTAHLTSVGVPEDFATSWFVMDDFGYRMNATKEETIAPITRGEVIYTLAKLMYGGEINEEGKYYELANGKYAGENSPFADTTVQYDANQMLAMMEEYNLGLEDGKDIVDVYEFMMDNDIVPSLGNSGTYYNMYPCMIALYENGLLSGSKNANGELVSGWNEPISRAELVALIERVAFESGKTLDNVGSQFN